MSSDRAGTARRSRPAVLLLLALLVPLLGLAPGDGATPGKGTASSCTTVLCTVQQAKPGATVPEELKGPKTVADLGDLAALGRELSHRTLQVSVDKGVTTGPGGSILLDLAKQDHRFVDPSSQVSTLDPVAAGQLRVLEKGGCDDLCTALTGSGAGPGTGTGTGTGVKALDGKDLIKNGQAKPEPTPPATNKSKPAKHSSGPSGLLIGGVVALLLALLALLALVVRRSSGGRGRPYGDRYDNESAPGDRPTEAMTVTTITRPARTPRPAELHPATVATDLHPQGYVDIDQCLYRAVWSDSDEPPAPGGAVEVARPDPDDPAQDPDVLLAFLPDQTAAPQRRLHA
ncbi:hypothetical protein [Streptacidiphilus sp. PAMC 29251]